MKVGLRPNPNIFVNVDSIHKPQQSSSNGSLSAMRSATRRSSSSPSSWLPHWDVDKPLRCVSCRCCALRLGASLPCASPWLCCICLHSRFQTILHHGIKNPTEPYFLASIFVPGTAHELSNLLSTPSLHNRLPHQHPLAGSPNPRPHTHLTSLTHRHSTLLPSTHNPSHLPWPHSPLSSPCPHQHRHPHSHSTPIPSSP